MMKDKKIKVKDGKNVQVTSDGRILWLNSAEGSMARFSARGWEVCDAAGTLASNYQFENRSIDKPLWGEWVKFATEVDKHHGVVLPDPTDWLDFELPFKTDLFKKNLSMTIEVHFSATRSDLLFSGSYVEVKLFAIRPRKKQIFSALIPGSFYEGEKFGRMMATKLAEEFCW